jgi:hypothetical protein
MKYLVAQLLLLPFLVGCDIGITVHDENRAAELVVDFLSGLKSEKGRQLAYDWTDNSYKDEVSFGEFTRIVFFIRDKNKRADIKLVGYEIFGPEETINIYASSEVAESKMYFKLSLVGTKHKDYYLSNLNTNDSEFKKNGIYRAYRKPIIVQGV